MKQEFTEAMQPGVKYAGYGFINAFREFCFLPQQKGKNEGRMKLIKQGEGWSVHSTNDNIVIHIKIPRKDKVIERVTSFLAAQTPILKVLREYDLSKKQSKTKKPK